MPRPKAGPRLWPTGTEDAFSTASFYDPSDHLRDIESFSAVAVNGRFGFQGLAESIEGLTKYICENVNHFNW